jgi:putative zinc finger/helix-turn-helix YgiT family protein
MIKVTKLRPAAFACPDCRGEDVRTTFETEDLPYGEGKAAVNLKVEVPVRQCLSCGLQFTDAAADDARDEAIRRHLGLLVPREIRQIREGCGASRREFASVTRIGEASLARWETGQLIQGAALDQFLFLLTFSENYERLRVRHVRPSADSDAQRASTERPKLRAIDGGRREELQESAQNFKLHAL